MADEFEERNTPNNNQSYSGEAYQNAEQPAPYAGNRNIPMPYGDVNRNHQNVNHPMPYSAQSYDRSYPRNPYPSYRRGYEVSGNGYDPTPMPPVPPPKKNNSGVKVALWSVCSVLGIIAVAVVLFLVQSTTYDKNISQESSRSGESPYSKAEHSYSADTSLPDAPSVGADENGPQVSTHNTSTNRESSSAAGKAYQKASDSVVCISSYHAGSDYTITASGEGSGIIITADGYIATNSHVVNDSKTTGVMITLTDGRQYLGTIIGIDRKTDLAVIKIDASDLKAAEFSNSDDVLVGDDAYAIGNPGGSEFSNSLTVGTISAVNRILSTNGYVKYIQTDAAINPGNSGGALINSEGFVIGINSSKLVATDFEGMGFAIPSNTAVDVINKIIKYGYVNDRGTLGIEGKTATLYSSKVNNIPQGMIITRIASDSPLNDTKARANDIITAINGTDIKNINEFVDILKNYKPGDKVTLSLFRSSEKSGGTAVTFDVEVVLMADTGE